MIRQLLKMGIRQFAARYNYDAGYMMHVTQVSAPAGIGLALLPLYSQFRGPKPAREVWAGAILASALDGDCGPCVQLVTDMAVEARVPPEHLARCLKGQAQDAGAAGLGFLFAQAAISDDPALEGLRQDIQQQFGESAVVAASFAASSGRIYPVLKRGLGFGLLCSKVSVGNETIQVAQHT